MKIELLCSLNSGQYNNGDIIDLSFDEAKRLIDNGFARVCSRASEISEAKPISREIPENPKKAKLNIISSVRKGGKKKNGN